MIRSKRGKKEAIIAALILVCMGLTYALFSGGTGLFCGIAEDSARGAVPLAADATTQRAAYGSIAEEAQRAALFAYAGVEPNISLTYASEDEAQGEEMASYTTSFAQSSSARVHNIALAAQALDGRKVEAGKEFSFNTAVGERTSERGYANAKVIVNGEYTEGVGGGVCQVSSTLYNAWVLAGLDVVKVQGHSLPAGYVPMSQDATVSKYIDLVLKNSAHNAVYIRAQVVGTDLNIAIFGKKQPFKVTLFPEIEQIIPAGEEIEYVDYLPSGKEYLVTNTPAPGYRTRLMAVYAYADGRTVKKQLRRDYYRPRNAKIHMIAD